jgi:hopanoid biosynthesis associated radical SAM protein HpnH
MRFPLGFTLAQFRHRQAMLRRGIRRFPTVLMLEPLYTCNLQCLGCAVERHTGKLADRLSPEKCLQASDDCGAPIVNICGGEPTLYPELPQLIASLMDRGRYVLCCTNAIRLSDRVFGVIPPDPKLFLMIHLDGMRDTHDMVCRRKGVFDTAIEGIREAKRRGYVVMVNTTVYRETSVEEVEEVCRLATSLRTDGILISPGYEYESADQDVFLTDAERNAKFERIRAFAPRYKVNVTPTFLDFAAGLIELPCSPWSTVNYTPQGWRAPCYLIGQSHYEDWKTFWEESDWAYWESRTDAKCRTCRMHSGFEHSAVEKAMGTLAGRLRMGVWTISR